jgi:hypothetical protein
MGVRRWKEIAGAVLVTAAVGVLAASGRATAAESPRGVVEDCSTRSEAGFPGAFTNRRENLVVGPLALIGAGGVPALYRTGNKFPLLVRAGHRVTVELSTRTRKVAGLAYGPLPQGQVRLRYTHRVVKFIACRSGEHSGSSADGRPVTFWSGGVLARSARCVPLLVWVDDEPRPRRAVIRLGVRHCA